MSIAENFIKSLVEKYDRHVVYTDGGTWYPQACRFLHLKQYLHSPLAKSMIYRKRNGVFQDRTECFEDYYHCIKNNNCDLKHAYNEISVFSNTFTDLFSCEILNLTFHLLIILFP